MSQALPGSDGLILRGSIRAVDEHMCSISKVLTRIGKKKKKEASLETLRRCERSVTDFKCN